MVPPSATGRRLSSIPLPVHRRSRRIAPVSASSHSAARRAVLGALALAPLAAAPPPATAQATIDGCPILPASNIWNVPVASLPVHPSSAAWIATIGSATGLHADFGSGTWEGGKIGIPFDSVPAAQPLVVVDFATLGWDGESDPGPYPIPADPQIEGEPGNATGDRHVLILEQGDCVLYEAYYTYPDGAFADSQSDDSDLDVECQAGTGGWCAASGAVYDLASNALRPDGWTSADAAGLPILPGLARWEEVAGGEIRHALRFTTQPTQSAYVWPARHEASSNGDPDLPPMGIRVRMRAGVDLSGLSEPARVIAVALKRYGMILADNGSDWYISGAPHESWDNDVLHELDVFTGADFEVVDVAALALDPDSGATPHLFSDGFERGAAAFALWSASEAGAP
jgi:hypothetical protein